MVCLRKVLQHVFLQSSLLSLAGASKADLDTWHDASDEVLPRSIVFDQHLASPNPISTFGINSPSRAQSQTNIESSPSHRSTPAVRSPKVSIPAVHLPPLTGSYATTPPALTLQLPPIHSPPVRTPESSPQRNRVLVDRSHNESDELILNPSHAKSESRTAPATPFYRTHRESENEPGNLGLQGQSKSRTKRAATPRSQTDRGLLSSFYQPPVTREIVRQKAVSRQFQTGAGHRSESNQRATAGNELTPVNAQSRADLVLNEGRHVKWWDTVEEADKENGGGGRKPKERSPRYSPKHMSATPSKSILKQVGYDVACERLDKDVPNMPLSAASCSMRVHKPSLLLRSPLDSKFWRVAGALSSSRGSYGGAVTRQRSSLEACIQ